MTYLRATAVGIVTGLLSLVMVAVARVVRSSGYYESYDVARTGSVSILVDWPLVLVVAVRFSIGFGWTLRPARPNHPARM